MAKAKMRFRTLEPSETRPTSPAIVNVPPPKPGTAVDGEQTMPMHTAENNAPTSSTCESEICPPVLLESSNNPVDFQGPLLTY